MNLITIKNTILKRVFFKNRKVLGFLGGLFLINFIAYGCAIYPLSQRVENFEKKDSAAELILQAARQEHEAAFAILAGTEQAAKELDKFYLEVLPADFNAARQLAYLRLDELSRQTNLRSERRMYAPVEKQGSVLTGLSSEVLLRGSYQNIRNFLYELEVAQEFILIDDLSLNLEKESALAVRLQLSTFFLTPD